MNIVPTDKSYTYDLLSESGGPKGTLYYTYDENNVKTYVTKDYDMDKRNGYPKFYFRLFIKGNHIVSMTIKS